MPITEEQNERLTRVGPGTPMGKVFRSYWIPACLSEEVPAPDAPPIRVQLLGEDLIAFRDTNGDVGLVEAYCAHRRAPLFYGRNEECGLRCVYHGWKFDKTGACVDVPSEPPQSQMKEHVRILAYPTYEAGGMVWTYMGPSDQTPAYPDYEWMRAPSTHARVSRNGVRCNYLQGVEGGIDTVHSSFLHNNDITNKRQVRVLDTHPTLDVEITDYGFMYTGIRNISADEGYYRVNKFLMQNQQMRANLVDFEGRPAKRPSLDGHIWVPMDDDHTMLYTMKYGASEDNPISDEEWWADEDRAGRGTQHLISGTYWTIKGPDNDYEIDREVQRTKTYTGIAGIGAQDQALVEGMGGIVDRTKEALGSTDKAIQNCRRLLLEATDELESGERLRGTDPDTYRQYRATEMLVPKGVPWKDATKEHILAEW